MMEAPRTLKEKNKWRFLGKLGAVLMSLFVIFGTTSGNTSAIGNFTGSGVASCINGAVVYVSGSYTISGVNYEHCHLAVGNIQNNSGIDRIDVNFSKQIPSNSIVVFSIVTKTNNDYGRVSWYTASNNYSVLSSSYGDYGVAQLVLYLDVPVSSISLRALNWGNPTSFDIDISSAAYTTLSDVPTSSQISSIQNSLNGLYNTNQSILANTDLIIQTIQDAFDDTTRTADAVEEQNRRDDEDRDNIEQQSSNIDDSASDSQSDAQSTGTTLLSAFTAFVNALTNANPSNCNIDMDLGNLDLGVVNLCQLSPPSGFTTLSSIFMILFCVPLSIATARKVISLFRSFQT